MAATEGIVDLPSFEFTFAKVKLGHLKHMEKHSQVTFKLRQVSEMELVEFFRFEVNSNLSN